jgi:N-acetylated-alpha-linked acidic dipeptidase
LFGDHNTEANPFADGRKLPHSAWPESNGISFEKLKQILHGTPSAVSAREWSKYYTSGPHLTGKNLSQAEWTRDRWEEWGIKSRIDSYDVYLNYPVDHRLALLEDGKVKFEATLAEDVLEEDPTTALEDRVPVFHGYSANGNVTASYVYVNYGTYEDFEDLRKANVSLKGKIALVKYGGIFRGLKAKRASELGMIGAVLYSDPGDDGEMTEEHGYKPYPEGPARNPSSVQRGSMQYLSVAPGDPTTPGYPSLPGAPRESVEGKIPDIPSVPISYTEALPLLKALNGHGPNVSSFPSRWHGGGLGYKGVEYSIGPSPESLTLNLYNEQEYVTTPLWNVIGIVNGSLADEVIVVGCHRDAWIAGGAGDPNSGSSALNEIVRSFGTALTAGWKPLRTIVFASWDGEEYGLLGSTEWVEEYIPWLSEATVSYINLDVGADGPYFNAAAAPVLNKVLYDVTADVKSPNQTVHGQTVRDLWDGKIGTMGSGSDFTAFQDFAGISSIHIEFRNGPDSPVYHYHSNYDSFHWMEKYGDPGFEYHVAIAQIGALLAAELAERPVIPFNATDYAVGLRRYLEQVKSVAEEQRVKGGVEADESVFKSLESAISTFQDVAADFDAEAAAISHDLVHFSQAPLSHKKMEELYEQARTINSKYKYLDRQFLYKEGLDSRSWFKHVVFAPGLWTGYAGATFPGLVEALQFGNASDVERWVDVIEQRVDGAVGLLEL